MADPYSVLGVSRDASEDEVRSAYRRLVKLHHPDHNNGSEASERRFEEVQEAYAEVQRLRAGGSARSGGSSGARPRAGTRPRPAPEPSRASDPELEARLAALEHQVLAARRARAKAEAAAHEAARTAREAAERVRAASQPPEERPSDEELGYIRTDDSIGKILSDARSTLADRYGKARQHPVAKRVSDLIDGLEELTEKLDRPPKDKRRR